ncbi:MAG TPA: Ig-like domain-containing protein, partial [Gemmatimonadales bacterium]|nr:Ig-like domain-containing protein [Gemmatimonadales bacterium]
VGEVSQVHASAYGEGDVVLNTGITWASGDASVASVDANGRVTAHRSGLALISATAEGVRGWATVVVVGATNFELTQVNGNAPPATMFQVGNTRYEAQSGTFRLTGAGRYEQVTSMVVYALDAPLYGAVFTSVGDVSRDVQTGEFIFTPDDATMPGFVGVKTAESTLRVTQRYFTNATESTVVYTVR